MIGENETYVRVDKGDREEFNSILSSLNIGVGPRHNQPSLFREMVACWKKLHCPECGAELSVRACACKGEV